MSLQPDRASVAAQAIREVNSEAAGVIGRDKGSATGTRVGVTAYGRSPIRVPTLAPGPGREASR